MKKKRYVELSHVLEPGASNRKLALKRLGAEEVNPNVVRLEGQWYIMHEITMVSHIGTHIEAPYHIFPDADDVAALSLDRLIGPGICLQFVNRPPNHLISLDEIEEEAKDVAEGDLVFCRYGYDGFYGTDRYSEAPRFHPEALEWLVEQGIHLLGVEAGGVELVKDKEHTNHKILLKAGVPLVENVANLGKLRQRRFEVYVLPIRIKGLESFPVTIVAVEDEWTATEDG
jgi:arylformamidase